MYFSAQSGYSSYTAIVVTMVVLKLWQPNLNLRRVWLGGVEFGTRIGNAFAF